MKPQEQPLFDQIDSGIYEDPKLQESIDKIDELEAHGEISIEEANERRAEILDPLLLERNSPDDEPLFDRCNTPGKLAIILVATIGAPIFFLVHTVATFYSATFNTEDTQQ